MLRTYNNGYQYHSKAIIIDNTGFIHKIKGFYINTEHSVQQWWNQLKLELIDFMFSNTQKINKKKYTIFRCPDFPEILELYSKIKQCPLMIRKNSHDILYNVFNNTTCYCVNPMNQNELWILEDYGNYNDMTYNIYQNVNNLIDKLYEATHFLSGLSDKFVRHDNTLVCYSGHPLQEVTQEQLSHDSEYLTGYCCDLCKCSESVKNSYQCKRCGFDICPNCIEKITKLKTEYACHSNC